MNLDQLLNTLYDRGFAIWTEAGRLCLHASSGALSKAQTRELQAAKGTLIPYLQQLGATAETWPLTRNQRALWHRHQIEPSNNAYHIFQAFELKQPFETQPWREAIRDLLLRHAMLRSHFFERDGRPYQCWPSTCPKIDTAYHGTDWDKDVVQNWLNASADTAFSANLSPPIRIELLHLTQRDGCNRTLVAVTVHHIAADFQAAERIVRELTNLYRARFEKIPADVAPIRDHFRSYLQDQSTYFEHAACQNDRLYWQKTLTTAPDPLAGLLPPANDPTQVPVAAPRHSLDADLSNRLRQTARQHAATMFTVVWSALQASLFLLTGETRRMIGTASSGRERDTWQAVIGDFVNLLPLITTVSARDTFATLLHRSKLELKQAQAHRRFPLLAAASEPFLEKVQLPAIYLAWNRHSIPNTLPETNATPMLRAEQRGHPFPLVLTVFDNGDRLTLTSRYDAIQLDRNQIEALKGIFRLCLEHTTGDPNRPLQSWRLMTTAARDDILSALVGPARPLESKLALFDAFDHRAKRYPDRIAGVIDCIEAPHAVSHHITYGALSQRARWCADHLRRLGVSSESVIAYRLPNRRARMITILGILAAGGICLPLSANEPQQRTAAMLAQSGARYLVGSQADPPEEFAAGKADVRYICAEDLIARPTLKVHPRAAVDARQTAFLLFTSGSTGGPKGVAIPHHAIIDLIAANCYVPIVAEDNIAHIANPAFDATTFEIWGAWLNGAKLHGFEGDWFADPHRWHGLLVSRHIRLMLVTTALLHRLAAIHPAVFPTRFKLVFGGERIQAQALRRLMQATKFTHVVNLYGPTENTTLATYHPIGSPPGQATVPIGKPLANRSALVLSSFLGLLPRGAVGELFLGGAGLARGYFNEPAATAWHFIPNPFAKTPGERLYRSGDRASLNDHAELLYHGRRDNQLKMRGFRIEPNEIQNAILSNPNVGECAVLLDSRAKHTARLIAYVTAKTTTTSMLDSHHLRAYLTPRLPAYMIPARFVILDKMPLTANGKVDRQALPRPKQTVSTLEDEPRTPTERWLVAQFKRLLDLEEVDRRTAFFHAGGHSLTATQLLTHIRQHFGHSMTLRSFYENPVVADLADWLDKNAQHAQRSSRYSTSAASPMKKRGPLSPEQMRLFLLCQLSEHSRTYHMPLALMINGPICVISLEQAWANVGRNHAMLTTVIRRSENGLVQEEDTDCLPKLRVIDGTGLGQQHAASLAQNLTNKESNLSFSMTDQPFVRIWLCQLATNRQLFMIHLHHIIADERSLEILATALSDQYEAIRNGTAGQSMKAESSFIEFVAAREAYGRSRQAAEDQGYWRKQLVGLGTPTTLSPDFSQSRDERTGGTTLRLTLPSELSRDLQACFQERGITTFTGMLGLFKIFLWQHSDQRDCPVGIPLGLREDAWQSTVGFFVNTAVIRSHITGDERPSELWQNVQDLVTDAQAHRRTPFQALVAQQGLTGSHDRTPLFQVFFLLHGSPWQRFAFSGSVATRLPLRENVSKFDLTLRIRDRNPGFEVTFEYDPAVFHEETIAQYSRHLARLAAEVVRYPGRPLQRLATLSKRDRFQLLHAFNAGRPCANTTESVVRSFYHHALKHGERIALVHRDETDAVHHWTYAGLAKWAATMADGLDQRRPGKIVAVGAQRHPRSIAAWLAVWWNGDAVVALDTQYPVSRLRDMLNEAQPSVLLTDQPNFAWPTAMIADIVDQADAVSRPLSPPFASPKGMDWPAYLIYSSGTTGRPKASVQHHHGLANLASYQGRLFGLSPQSRVLQFSNTIFDAFVWEMTMALTHGGTLVMGTSKQLLPGPNLGHFLARERTSHATLPPSALTLLNPRKTPQLECLIVAGEACSRHTARVWSHGRTFFNAYGPSETTVCATTAKLEPDVKQVGIGKPIDGFRTYVVNHTLWPMPLGAPGQLVLAGVGIGQGYLQRPRLTARTFVPNPFGAEPGERLYLTGDRVRFSAGKLIFQGRVDRQIKIRGIRVEPEEVETILVTHGQVAEAAVVGLNLDKPMEAGLYIYWSPRAAPPTEQELRAWLSERLPAGALPRGFTRLPKLPRTLAGKVDMDALPEPEMTQNVTSSRPPRTAMEIEVANVWADVLNLKCIDIERNFFDCGGNSLHAVTVQSRLQQSLGEPVSMMSIFRYPTIATLAANLQVKQTGTPMTKAKQRAAKRKALRQGRNRLGGSP